MGVGLGKWKVLITAFFSMAVLLVSLSPFSSSVLISSSNTIPSAAAQNDSSVPISLKGSVTTEPAYVDNYLLVGASKGLYVFSDNTLETYIETSSVRDFAKLGENRVVLAVEETYFPNIKCYDLSTGEVLWSHSHTMAIYDTELGYIDRQVQPFDVELLGDLNGDGVSDVAVSAGHSIVGISGESGEALWEVTHTLNVWQLTRLGDTLFAGTQDGYLYSINPSSGGINFKRQLAGSVELKNPESGLSVGKAARSVWDIAPIQVSGSNKLAVSTEDGMVQLVDPGTGNVEWERMVLQYNDALLLQYYESGSGIRGGPFGNEANPTIPTDANFFNIRLTIIDDVDGNGSEEIVAAIDPQSNPTGRSYGGTQLGLYLLEGSTGEVQWQNLAVDMSQAGNLVYTSIGGEKCLLVYSGATISVIDISSGSIENTIGMAATASGESYLVALENGLVLASAGGLVATDFDGEFLWDFPSISNLNVVKGDFTSDGNEDFLIYSIEAASDDFTWSRSLILRDGDNGTVLWSKILPLRDFLENGGFTRISKVENMFGEGGADVLVCREVETSEMEDSQASPKVILFSGDNGEVIWERELVNEDGEHLWAEEGEYLWVFSLESTEDINGNGSLDVLVGSRGRVFIIDGENGELLWERVYHDDAPAAYRWDWVEHWEARYLIIDDVNDDGYKDLVCHASDRNLVVLETNESGGELSFSIRSEVSSDRHVGNRISSIGDLDGDGCGEVIFDTYIEGAPSQWTVLSPKSGEILLSVVRDGAGTSWAAGDFTGDGLKDTINFRMWSEAGPKLSVYASSEVVWSYIFSDSGPLEKFGYEQAMPAASVGDINGDGREELAVVKTCGWGEGAKIDIYDVTNDEVLKTIAITEVERGRTTGTPGILTKKLSDFTGDGSPELGVVALTDGSVTFYVIDPQEGEPLAGLDSQPAEILDMGEQVGILGSDASLVLIDPTKSVKITSFGEESPLSISWSTEEACVTTVKVDGFSLVVTTGNSATVRLPPSKHKITVQSVNSEGVFTYDVVNVNVRGGSSLDLVLGVIAVCLVVVLFAPRYVKRVWGIPRFVKRVWGRIR